MNKLLPLLLIAAMVVLGTVIKIAITPSEEVATFNNNGEPGVPGDLARRSSGVAGDRDDPSETIRTLTQLQQQTFELAEKDRLANQKMRDSMNQQISEGVSTTLEKELTGLRQVFSEETEAVKSKYEQQILTLQEQVDEAKATAANAAAEAKSMAEKAALDARNRIKTATTPPSNQVALLETENPVPNDFGFDDLALNTQASLSVRDNSAYTSLRPLTAGAVGTGESGLLNGVADPLNPNNMINNAVNHVNKSDSLLNHPNQPGNKNTNQISSRAGSSSGGAGNSTPGEPMYTINDGATLFSNTTMTALIGKVPVGRSVSDPFRFKLVTGTENLAASKMYIAKPIANVIWTGYTTGNRELSCVSGYLDTVTLVYADGTISTTSTKRGGSRTTDETSYLGYISDQWGKPCIRGQLYDNGESYLQSRAGLASIAAAAEGVSIAQTEIQESAEGRQTTNITGDIGSYVAGQALSGAAKETLDYFAERTLGTFDVVFVPSGKSVTIHVETQIEFNYDSEGRRLSHVSLGESNAYLD